MDPRVLLETGLGQCSICGICQFHLIQALGIRVLGAGASWFLQLWYGFAITTVDAPSCQSAPCWCVMAVTWSLSDPVQQTQSISFRFSICLCKPIPETRPLEAAEGLERPHVHLKCPEAQNPAASPGLRWQDTFTVCMWGFQQPMGSTQGSAKLGSLETQEDDSVLLSTESTGQGGGFLRSTWPQLDVGSREKGYWT